MDGRLPFSARAQVTLLLFPVTRSLPIASIATWFWLPFTVTVGHSPARVMLFMLPFTVTSCPSQRRTSFPLLLSIVMASAARAVDARQSEAAARSLRMGEILFERGWDYRDGRVDRSHREGEG